MGTKFNQTVVEQLGLARKVGRIVSGRLVTGSLAPGGRAFLEELLVGPGVVLHRVSQSGGACAGLVVSYGQAKHDAWNATWTPGVPCKGWQRRGLWGCLILTHLQLLVLTG